MLHPRHEMNYLGWSVKTKPRLDSKGRKEGRKERRDPPILLSPPGSPKAKDDNLIKMENDQMMHGRIQYCQDEPS